MFFCVHKEREKRSHRIVYKTRAGRHLTFSEIHLNYYYKCEQYNTKDLKIMMMLEDSKTYHVIHQLNQIMMMIKYKKDHIDDLRLIPRLELINY
jgi:hypothetical protein